jgi:hypothetical protein
MAALQHATLFGIIFRLFSSIGLTATSILNRRHGVRCSLYLRVNVKRCCNGTAASLCRSEQGAAQAAQLPVINIVICATRGLVRTDGFSANSSASSRVDPRRERGHDNIRHPHSGGVVLPSCSPSTASEAEQAQVKFDTVLEQECAAHAHDSRYHWAAAPN